MQSILQRAINVYALILAWTYFWLGDWASKILELNEDSEIWCDVWYPIYNFLMTSSSEVQDRYNLSGPWEPVADE